MTKKILTLLCMLALLAPFVFGTQVIGASYQKQDFVAKNAMRWNDDLEGHQIDIEKVIIADDGNMMQFNITSANPYDKKALMDQHIYIFLDTDRNTKTGSYSAPYDLGIDRVVEIVCAQDQGTDVLAAVVHDGKQRFGISTSIAFDGKKLDVELPIEMIGAKFSFDWKLQVYSNNTDDYKAFDAVPENGPATYDFYRTAASFSDLKPNDWFYANVNNLIALRVVDGYSDGTFKPNKNITRAEFCKVILSALKGLSTTNTASSFKDIESHWAQGYILKAQALGIVNGYADGEFRPNNNISRAEIAKIIFTARSLTSTATAGAADSSGSFKDCTGHWAENYIGSLRSTNIISGYQDMTFRPQNYATRAEVCKIIASMMAVK